jgi:hypothetical protein
MSQSTNIHDDTDGATDRFKALQQTNGTTTSYTHTTDV